MRLLKIFVLLLISGTAFGQSGAAMLMTSADAVETYLLDDYAADAAYSLRLLKADHADSSAIRVRRSSDNAEQDIGFTAQGYLDTASLKTFVSTNSGYVVKCYDQSGNESDLNQATAAKQPIIVNAGTVVRKNGFVAMDFDGSNDALVGAGIDLSAGISSWFVGASDVTTADNDFFAAAGDDDYQSVDNWFGFRAVSNNFTARINVVSNTEITDGALDTDLCIQHLNLVPSTSMQYYIDGALISNTASTETGANMSHERVIGGIDNPAALFNNMKFNEWIVYDSDQSANRTAIENNINDHYQLYWNGATAGLLDTFPSDAAYSLRALSSTYTGPLVKVRRSSDNAELDIYATFEGYLDTASMKTFVGANSGYVVTWYDQSGNGNDATQSTASNQPRIVNAGTVERSNGEPAIRSDGSDDYMQSPPGAIGTVSNFMISAVVTPLTTSTAKNFLAISNGRYTTIDHWTVIRHLSGSNSATIARPLTQSTLNNGTSDLNQHLFITEFAASTSFKFGLDGSYVEDLTSIPSSLELTQEIDIFCSDNAGSIIDNSQTLSQEFIVWGSDQSSNRSAIESNINTHYSIY